MPKQSTRVAAGLSDAGASGAPGRQALAGQGGRALSFMAIAFVIGVVVRLQFVDFVTLDMTEFLRPWVDFAYKNGWGSLATAFTNYAPFYSYLLIIFTKVLGNEPHIVVKGISAIFELANALLLYGIVAAAGGGTWQRAAAFAAAWLAPTVVTNGSVWGQADAIWSSFILLSLLVFVRGGNGILPFAGSIAVKLQGMFFGPFALAMALRQRRAPMLILALPLMYVLVALPVILAGRPFMEVMLIYADQGGTYHALSMNAASIWAILRHVIAYDQGVIIGLVMAAIGGLALTYAIWRNPRTDATFLVLAATCSLLLMPYLLPKMHDRYFYGFEIAVIALACLRRRYLFVAVAAQFTGIAAYLVFLMIFGKGVAPAALVNGMLLLFLVVELVRAKAPQTVDGQLCWR